MMSQTKRSKESVTHTYLHKMGCDLTPRPHEMQQGAGTSGTLEQDVPEAIQMKGVHWQTSAALCCAVLAVCGELLATGNAQL